MDGRATRTALKLLAVACLISFNAMTAEAADYDDDFKKAAELSGNEALFGTDRLIRGTTEILHKENLKTHAELEQLKKEIEELKKALKEVKDTVESAE